MTFDSVRGATNCLDSFLGVKPDTGIFQNSLRQTHCIAKKFFAVETAVEETLN